MARGRAIPLGGRPRPGARIVVKLLLIALILVLVAGLVLVGAGGFFTYEIVTARDDVETVTPSSFLLSHVDTLGFTDTDGEQHDGWLLRGLRGAPVVILCHGYNSNRSEMLSVGTMLQDNRFNVYLFNFWPSQPRRRISDLGVRQAKVLASAIATVTRQEGINPRRLGLFGKNTGGYASLAVAERNPLVKALAVVNVYENPLDMFNAQIDQSLGSTPVFRVIADAEFRLLNLRSDPPAVGENISKLDGMAKFFVSGRDVPSLASTTEKFYGLAPQPKRLLVMDRPQAALETGAERKELENQLLIFFQQNLPLRAD
jgi:pimeloyl-ACP methyl ester carboxylesterase